MCSLGNSCISKKLHREVALPSATASTLCPVHLQPCSGGGGTLATLVYIWLWNTGTEIKPHPDTSPCSGSQGAVEFWKTTSPNLNPSHKCSSGLLMEVGGATHTISQDILGQGIITESCLLENWSLICVLLLLGMAFLKWLWKLASCLHSQLTWHLVS